MAYPTIRAAGALVVLMLLGACEGGMTTRPTEQNDPVVTEEGAVIPSPDSGDDLGDTTGYGGEFDGDGGPAGL